MLQGLNQSNKRDEILLLARSQHKHLLQYGLPLLQQLVLVTFGDKELEQMDCVIWNGSDCGPSWVKLRLWLQKILVWIHFCSYQCKEMTEGFGMWTLVWFLDTEATRQNLSFPLTNNTKAGHSTRTHCSNPSAGSCFTLIFFTERP